MSSIPRHVNPCYPVKASYWFPDGEHSDTLRSAKDIDSTLFTYLFCAFADIDERTCEVSVDKHKDEFHAFTATVKAKNQKVHTLLSIGGRKADCSVFSTMANDSSLRRSFIDSSIKIARECGFRGLDLAWRYPDTDIDMDNLAVLLKEWKSAVIEESKTTEEQPLLLTAAAYYSPNYKPLRCSSITYPVRVMNQHLDWVNVIAYDFYTPGSSKVTGPPAALHDHTNAQAPSGYSGVQQWMEAGLKPQKIVFGLPYLGWAWTLTEGRDHGYHADAKGPAITHDGSVIYDRIRNIIVDEGAITHHEQKFTGDYCHFGKTWIGYNDNESIVHKVVYAKESELAGYFSWHVGADYKCGLSRAASRAWDTLYQGHV